MNNSKEISDFLDSILSLQDEQNDQIKRFTEVTKSLSKNADTVSSVISKYSKREDTITLETSKLIKELTGTVIQNINEFAKYTKSDRNDEFGEKFEEKFEECKSSIILKLNTANTEISELKERQQCLKHIHKNLKDDESDENSFENSIDSSD